MDPFLIPVQLLIIGVYLFRIPILDRFLDKATLFCYGWSDIDPKHDFYQDERGRIRFTIETTTKNEILQRLLKLNFQIVEREQKRE